MAIDLVIRSLLIIIPCMIVMYLLSILRKIRRPDQLSIFAQVKQYYDDRKEAISEYYSKKSEMDRLFEEAGLFIDPGKVRIVRDTLTIFFLVVLHMQYFSDSGNPVYPFDKIVYLAIFYMVTILQPYKPFPIIFLLGYLKKDYEKRKNKEIFLLQQIVLNEYSALGVNQTKQKIYHLFKYLLRYMNVIRPAMIHFVSEYNQDAHNPKMAFSNFGNTVGTEEAINLSDILFQIDQSSGEDVQDLLKSQYEELKTNRQESYRSSMQDRGHIGYIITFTGVVLVIGLAMVMYYLEHQDQMKFLITNN